MFDQLSNSLKWSRSNVMWRTKSSFIPHFSLKKNGCSMWNGYWQFLYPRNELQTSWHFGDFGEVFRSKRWCTVHRSCFRSFIFPSFFFLLSLLLVYVSLETKRKHNIHLHPLVSMATQPWGEKIRGALASSNPAPRWKAEQKETKWEKREDWEQEKRVE